jgi:hypothetical protein
MIYIPTVEHDEPYDYTVVDIWSEEDKDTNVVYYSEDTKLYYYRQMKLNDDGTIARNEDNSIIYEWVGVDLPKIYDNIQEFTKGFYYTWNGYYWVESEAQVVYFSNLYVEPSNASRYWYRDTIEELSHNGIIYKPYGLYKYEMNVGWVEVNILDGNATNRAVGAIRQMANEIALDVTNAVGNLAHLGVRVDEKGSIVDSIASVVTKVDGVDIKRIYESEEGLPQGDGNYYAVGTKAPYDIYKNGIQQTTIYYDGVNVMKPNIASIITAANEDTTSITLSANKISFDGYSEFINTENGTITSISGSLIKTGTIRSNDGTVAIDLGNSTACISGKISATSGWIGDEYGNGFEIKSRTNNDKLEYYLGNNQISYDGSILPDGVLQGASGVYIGPDGIGLGNGKFYVDNSGNLTTKGSINMDGNITMSGDITLNGNISWGHIDDITNLVQESYDYAVNAYDNVDLLAIGEYSASKTTFISGKKIYTPEIEGGVITGGLFYSTGIGDETSTDRSAYYMLDDQGEIAGTLRYDINGVAAIAQEVAPRVEGEGDVEVSHNGKTYYFTADSLEAALHDAVERVWFQTSSGVAMKFQSGGDMSFYAEGGNDRGGYGAGTGKIYFASDVVFMGEVSGNIRGDGGTAKFG